MARPDLLVHTFELKNESLVISDMNKEKIVNKNFNKTLDELHSNGDKRLAHIEHIDTEKVLHGKKKDDILEGKNDDKQLGDTKDNMVENKGEQLVHQIERHDSDLNNDIVMARPDLLVHTFDLNNESLVINETNKEKLVDEKFTKIGLSENDVESQINAPPMNKGKNMKKIMDQQLRGNKEIKLKENEEKVEKRKDIKTKKEKVNPRMKHDANRKDKKRKGKKEAVRDHDHQFGIIEL